MPKQKYITQIAQVEALQLTSPGANTEGSAHEMAFWCRGRSLTMYNAHSNQMDVEVLFLAPGTVEVNEFNRKVTTGEWLVKSPNGEFLVVSNDDFKIKYEVNNIVPVPTCWFCLADTTNTKMSDDSKKCPECSSGYVGNSRVAEFDILKAAGAVRGL